MDIVRHAAYRMSDIRRWLRRGQGLTAIVPRGITHSLLWLLRCCASLLSSLPQRSRYDHSDTKRECTKRNFHSCSHRRSAAVVVTMLGSDPWKMSRFRALMRLTTDCVRSSECDHSSPAFRNYTRFVLKSAEHTWSRYTHTFLSSISV